MEDLGFLFHNPRSTRLRLDKNQLHSRPQVVSTSISRSPHTGLAPCVEVPQRDSIPPTSSPRYDWALSKRVEACRMRKLLEVPITVEGPLALSYQSYFVLLPLPVPSVMYCIVTSYLNNISQFVWKASAVLPRLPVQQTSTEYVEKYRETAQDYLKATKPTENAENNQPGLFPGEASHSLRPSPKLCGDGDENRNVMRSMTRMISISGPCHLLV